MKLSIFCASFICETAELQISNLIKIEYAVYFKLFIIVYRALFYIIHKIILN